MSELTTSDSPDEERISRDCRVLLRNYKHGMFEFFFPSPHEMPNSPELSEHAIRRGAVKPIQIVVTNGGETE